MLWTTRGEQRIPARRAKVVNCFGRIIADSAGEVAVTEEPVHLVQEK